MQKHFSTIFVLIFSLLMFSPGTVHAYETGYVDTGSSLNVRDSADDSAPVIGSLMNRQSIEFVDVGNGWGQITYNQRVGYINLDFIRTSGESSSATGETVATSDAEAELEPSEAALGSVQRIVLDPGHGGHDPGAIVRDRLEKDLTLDIAERAASYLSSAGFEVSLTRSGDQYVALDERAAYANGQAADIFISIHANASFDVSANGIETFYMPGSSGGETLARSLQEMAATEVPMRNRGTFANDFRVLRDTHMPAALVEFGFMTNSHDRELQQTDLMRDQSARAILRAVEGL